jgi:hypothetical protein
MPTPSRLRILALFAALIALAMAFSACGGGGSDDPKAVVDEATLKGIESGDVDLSLGIDVQGRKGGRIDVSLAGPFRSEGESQLPELDMTAAAKGGIGGEEVDFEGGLTLLGTTAYVNYEGTEYEVDPTTFNFVRSLIQRQGGGDRKRSTEVTACQEAVSELQVGDFVDDVRDEGSADVGGTGTNKVSGDLDASGAVDALIELSQDPACSEQLSAASPLPSTAELNRAKDSVQEAVKAANVELYVGDDHIVRRIEAQATIEPPKGSGSEGAERVDLDFELILTGVNEEQTISAPRSSKPLSDLFLKLGINPIELLGLLEGQGGQGGPGGLNELLESLGSVGSRQ